MNNAQLTRAFMKRAQVLAHVVTGSKNIKVTIQGNQAFRRPGLINLPNGDFSNPEWVCMTQGWIDHELGHEDETCHKVTQQACSESKVLNDFRQIIEDVRMERSRGIKFPGARLNLNKLAELAIKRKLFSDPTNHNAGQLVTAMCLYYGRSKIIGQNCLNEYSNIAITRLKQAMGVDVVEKILSAIDKTAFATSNSDSLNIAREILQILEDAKDDSNEKSDEESDADSDGDSNEKSDEESDADSDGDSNEKSDEESDADSDGDSNEKSDEESDADSDGDSNEKSDEESDADSDGDSNEKSDEESDADSDDDSNEKSDEESDADSDSDSTIKVVSGGQRISIAQIIQEIEDDELEDFHDALSELLSQDAEEDLDSGKFSPLLDLETVSSTHRPLGGICDEVLARRLSGGVYQAMHKVLFDQDQTLNIRRKTGSRIVNSRLSGVSAGNLSVFSRRIDQVDITAAVTVLVDASSSMRHRPDGEQTLIEQANVCALAFAKGLEKSRVATEVIYYGENDDDNFLAYTAKSFDQTCIPNNFAVQARGPSTPTGEAMSFALNNLVLRREKRKLFILLTDGDPDSKQSVLRAREIAQAFHIAVVPIGIGTDVVKGFENGEFVTINDPSQLTNALKEAVRSRLFN